MKKRTPMRNAVALLTALAFLLSFAGQPLPAQAATSQLITMVPTTGKVVALTFDDGSDGTNIPAILKILSDYNVKATFFVTGKAVENHPSQIERMIAQGHSVGNHSYDHPEFTTISADAVISQLDRTEVLFKDLTGRTTKPYFRPPFGSCNSLVLETLGSSGYAKTIKWNIDTIDWDGRSAYQIYSKVLSNIVPGSIVLMHTGAGAKDTPAALPTMIEGLKAKGYRFVTIPQLLALMSSHVIYTVKAWDTLRSVAQRFCVTVDQICAANNLTEMNPTRVGQLLVIPERTGASAVLPNSARPQRSCQ